MAHIVGFTGAGGTGKTTVLNGIVEALKNEGITDIQVAPSIVRDVYKECGYHTEEQLKSMDKTQQLEFQMTLFDRFEKYYYEIEERDGNFVDNKVIIFDRTLLDHYAYLTFVSAQNSPGLSKLQLKNRRNRTEGQLQELDTVVYFPFPPKFEIKADGFRVANEAQNIILDLIQEEHVEWMVAPNNQDDTTLIKLTDNSSVEDRVWDIVDKITNDLKRKRVLNHTV